MDRHWFTVSHLLRFNWSLNFKVDVSNASNPRLGTFSRDFPGPISGFTLSTQGVLFVAVFGIHLLNSTDFSELSNIMCKREKDVFISVVEQGLCQLVRATKDGNFIWFYNSFPNGILYYRVSNSSNPTQIFSTVTMTLLLIYFQAHSSRFSTSSSWIEIESRRNSSIYHRCISWRSTRVRVQRIFSHWTCIRQLYIADLYPCGSVSSSSSAIMTEPTAWVPAVVGTVGQCLLKFCDDW